MGGQGTGTTLELETRSADDDVQAGRQAGRQAGERSRSGYRGGIEVAGAGAATAPAAGRIMFTIRYQFINSSRRRSCRGSGVRRRPEGVGRL